MKIRQSVHSVHTDRYQEFDEIAVTVAAESIPASPNKREGDAVASEQVSDTATTVVDRR